MAKGTYMRVDPKLLVELKKMKVAKRESYSDVVGKMLKHIKKDIRGEI
jgi:predicted CopG family antitoxin